MRTQARRKRPVNNPLAPTRKMLANAFSSFAARLLAQTFRQEENSFATG